MIRQIIKINSERCDGCGICLTACDEGALQIIHGKAVLIKDDYCDGLGNCLPVCPQDAIRFEMREAVEFNEKAVEEHLKKNKKKSTTPSVPTNPQNYDIYEQFSIPVGENPLPDEILTQLATKEIEHQTRDFSQFNSEEPRVLEPSKNEQVNTEEIETKSLEEKNTIEKITESTTPIILNKKTLNDSLTSLNSEIASLDAELESINTELTQIDIQIDQEIAQIHGEMTSISAQNREEEKIAATHSSMKTEKIDLKKHTSALKNPNQIQNIKEEQVLNTPKLDLTSSAHAIQHIAKTPNNSQKLYGNTQLRQWPIQMKLVPTKTSYFENNHLLIAADCSAFAYADFHNKFMKNKALLVACPKLDNCDYTSKIAEILSTNTIKSITVVRMEVPCCSHMEKMLIEALKQTLEKTNKFLPWQSIVISTKGKILK